jgi:dTDP-4-dehydrorhamnose reductase
MKKSILITGANGMFGQDAAKLFLDSGYDVLKATKNDLDVTSLEKVREFFAKNKIDFVLHAAGYTKVDDAETNRDLAFLINAEGAKNVAIASNEKSIPIIYISTDYVFDGEKGAPYLTGDKTNPINVYGASKLAGEEAVKQANPKHYIARTSWLYGQNGKNFVDTMIALSKTQKSLKIVNDQFGCPTWTVDLAEGVKTLIEKNMPFGTYHLCGGGIANWFEFAKKIFEILKIEIEVIPVATTEFPRPAKRPKFSAMENGSALGDWEDGLNQYLRNKAND